MGLFNIIGKYKIWISVGVVLMMVAVFAFFSNMRYSIEFTGGIGIKVQGNVDNTDFKNSLSSVLEDAGFSEDKRSISISKVEDNISDITIKLPVGNDQKMSEVSDSINQMLIDQGFVDNNEDILEVSIIGPSIGEYMKNTAIKALIRGVVLMMVYMLFAFSSLRNFISPGVLALITIFTMLFDVSIAAGGYGVFMWLNNTIEVNTVFIIAILTTMGYSINDTIVILDRVRENFMIQEKSLRDGKTSTAKIFESSLWQTMRRSIGTSVSTLLVVVAMFILGTGMLKTFAFTMGLGIIAGTYSSIFLAAPLAYIFTNKSYSSEDGK